MAILVVICVMPMFGCRQHLPTQPRDIIEVQGIQLFKARPLTSPPAPTGIIPPPPDWALGEPINSYPDNVQETFNPGDKMFLGLRFTTQPNTPVTFSKYTFFNKETSKEWEIGSKETGKAEGISLGELGPFGGQAFFPFINNTLSVPGEGGKYEIRIYLGNTAIASAVFEVVSAP